MSKIFRGIKVQGDRPAALRMNKFVWFLLKHNLVCVKDSYLYASIKIKVIFYALLITVLFTTILGSLLVYIGKNHIEKNMKDYAVSLSDNIGKTTAFVLAHHDLQVLKSYFDQVSGAQDLFYVVLLDQDQRILASVDPDTVFQHLWQKGLLRNEKSSEAFLTADGRRGYNLVHDLNLNSDSTAGEMTERLKSAKLYLGFSWEGKQSQLAFWILHTGLYTLGLILIFMILVTIIADRTVSPIKRLVDATARIAEGDLDYTVPDDRTDELGILIQSFNDMIAKVKESQAEIERYARTLEQKVKDRTLKLQASEEKYRTLFEHSGAAVALLQDDGELCMVNKQFENLSGFSKSDLECRVRLTDFLQDSDRELVQQYFGGKNGKAPVNLSCTFFDREENEKKINLTLSPMPGSKEVLASMVDVTESQALQQQLNRSKQLAAIGELSALIAHEIRNPLGAINTSVAVLKNSLTLEGEDRELMDIICEEINRLDKIINDFLKFARITKSRFQKTDVNQLLRDTLVLFRGMMGETIREDLQLAPELTPIHADPGQLKQVFMNIILNAVEAMPNGGSIAIKTELVPQNSKRERVRITIRDTGPGIKESELHSIFKPFFTTKENGGGMGLAISERIVNIHGGTIAVESQPMNGTTFIITLPMEPPVNLNA